MSSTILMRNGTQTPAPVLPATRHDRPTPAGPNPYRGRRTRRLLGLNAVQLVAWASVAMVVLIYLADRGTSGWDSLKDVMKSAGILAGLVSADLMCIMVLLASRIPLLDRLMGHDKAIDKHSNLGSWVVGGIFAHGILLTSSYALSAHTSFLSEFTSLWSFGDYALAVVSFALLLVVGATSALLSIRKHLPHQLWYGIHLTTYAALAISIPHQFSMDSMFDAAWARDYWIGMYAVTAFCLIAYRVVLPLMNSLNHRLVVTKVTDEGPNLVSIEMTGRHLEQLDVQGGQFLNWRFWSPALFWESHPFSLSAGPDGRTLRITVKVVGDGTRRLARVRPGTKVSIEGPYGVFTDDARTREALVLMGSGSGIAPIRSLLESTETVPGRSLVVLRATHGDELVHFEEFREICRARGIQLVTLVGHRGSGWTPASAEGVTLVQLAPWIADADLYVCGPRGWMDEVAAEAEHYGVHPAQVHAEAFAF